MCPPFAEERKSSARVMTLAARQLCHYGFYVLRFDYTGCGESDGDFQDATMEMWKSDIGHARTFVTGRTGVDSCGALGIRLGATLLADTVIPGMWEFAVLWAPALFGATYLADYCRRIAASRLVSDKHSSEVGSVTHVEGTHVDIGGYWLSDESRAQLQALSLPRQPCCKARAAIVVSLSAAGRGALREHAQVCQDIVWQDGPTRVANVRARPFWVTASRYDPRELVDVTAAYLSDCGVHICLKGRSVV
jgi:hypothetical protein